MSYLMSDDEPLALPQMLPTLVSSGMLPPNGSENVLDMVTQDMMFGSEYESTLSSASTEVTYASQYMTCSAAPFTSAGDVFLPSIPITTASNTFVKPLHTFVQYTPLRRNSNPIVKPNPRLASSMPTKHVDNLLTPKQGQTVKKSFAALTSTRSRNTTSKISTKNSSGRSQGFLSIGKTPSRSTSRRKCRKSSVRTLPFRSKGQSILLINASNQSAFVSASTRGSSASATLTKNSITRTSDIVTESSVTFATEALTSTTVTQTVSHHETLKTDTLVSYTDSRTQSPVTAVIPSTNLGGVNLNSSTTCALTSYTATKPRTTSRRAIVAPMETTYTLPTSMLYSTPTIISRALSTSTAVDRSSEKVHEQFAVIPAQAAYAIPTGPTSRTSPTTTADAAPRPRTRLVIPFATSGGSIVATTTTNPTTATKSRVAYTFRPTQSAYATSSITTTTSAALRTLAHSAFALSSAATLYTTKSVLPGRTTRSRAASVSKESQTYTISDGKGSYTTLTISSDFTDNSPAHQTQSSSSIAAGVGSHTSSLDSIPRPRSQLLIPIANSQMNTSTSLGYLVTSPIGSDIITARSSSAAASIQSSNTASIGSHTITTISSETLNRIRSRLIVPLAHNIPSTAAGLSSHPTSTVSVCPNRTRGPVTIIANQLLSAVTSRDSSGTSITAAASDMARSLLSGASTQGLYSLSTPVTTHMSSVSVADSSARPVSRMVIPIISSVQTTSNSQTSSTTTEVASSITTRAIPAAPTPGTYIIASGIESSSTDGDTTSISSRVVIPIMQNTTATTTVATTTNRPLLGVAGGSEFPSSVSNTDPHSRLRSRLILTHTTENSTSRSTTPVTAYTINRSRAGQSLYAIPAGSTTYTTSTKPPDTMTLITIGTTSAASPSSSSSHSMLMSSSSAHSESPSPTTISLMTTPTPTLENTGNRYVIKLATTPSGTAGASSVTAAVTTPLTTAALSPSDHHFLEPRPVSRLRTFPAPRTYSVAQRSAAGHVVQKPAVRNVVPRSPPKRCLSSPAPLQIFTEVVCPPTNTQSQTTAVTPGHSKPRFTLTHSPGNSTLVVPQYKNTVFKNLSTIAHPTPERASSRYLTPRSSYDRFVLNRPVAFVTPRRLAPGTMATSSVTQRTAPRPLRFTYADTRSPAEHIAPVPSQQQLVAPSDQSDENY